MPDSTRTPDAKASGGAKSSLDAKSIVDAYLAADFDPASSSGPNVDAIDALDGKYKVG